MSKTIFCLAIFFLLCCFDSSSQQPFIQTTITEADGLLSNYVQDMVYDGQQRLWIATDKGVSVYDGKRFTHFTTSAGLDNSYVNKLVYHPASNCMLVLTAGNAVFAIRNDTVTYVPVPSLLSKESIVILQDGAIAISTLNPENNLALYILKDPLSRNVEPALVGKLSLLNCIRLADSKSILCTNMAMYQQHIVASSLHVKAVAETANTLYLREVFAPGDTLFFSQEKRSLRWSYHGKTVSPGQEISGFQWLSFARCSYLGTPALAGIDYNATVVHLLTVDGKIIRLHNKIANTPVINKVLSTPGKNILLATMGEGVKVFGTNQSLLYWPNKKVGRIGYYQGTMWAVADEKLVCVQTQTNAIHASSIQVAHPTSVSFHDGQMHITSLLSYDVFAINNNTTLIKKYSFKSGMGISGYLPFSNGDYSVSTYSRGVWHFTQNHVKKQERSKFLGNLHDDIIEQIIQLPNAVAYTSYTNGVLIENTGGHQLFNKKNGLLSNAVYHINQWQNEWHVGTEEGWQRRVNGKWITYTSEQGFVGKRAMYSFVDSMQRMFVVSEKRLMLVEDSLLRTLYTHPVLPTESATLIMAWFDTATQQLWCATSQGLMKLNIADMQPDTVKVAPVLYAWSANKTILPRDATSNIRLPHDATNILFTCGLDKIDFTGKAMLYYTLEGWSNEWLPAPADFNVSFQALPAGNFTLKMYAVNPDGVKSDIQKIIGFRILPAWYLQWPMLIVYSITLLFLLWRILKYWANKKVERSMRQFVLEQQLQAERNRISSELHDNVGSQLTNIIVQLDYVESALHLQKADNALQKVEALQQKARHTMNQLRESIWALKDNEISLADFLLKLQQYALQVFDEESGIAFDMKHLAVPHQKLSPWQAVNLLRIFQEAFQNIQKHATARQVKLQYRIEEKTIAMRVEDDGIGFDAATIIAGHGINNMRRRAEEMGGVFTISSNQHGTHISIQLPLS